MDDHELQRAKYLVSIDSNGTVLCGGHAKIFQDIQAALSQGYEMYELDAEDEPIVCQACHLAWIKTPGQKTTH